MGVQIRELLAAIFLGVLVERGFASEPDTLDSDKIIPSGLQQSYPLMGLACFPDGVRLPCKCSVDEYYHPCCRDWITNECYLPTFHCWSKWHLCLAGNDLCLESQECRIKYDDAGYEMGLPSTSQRNSERGGLPEIPVGNSWFGDPKSPRCQIQRIQCRESTAGEWGDWMTLSDCSETCTVGTQTLFRNCYDEDGNKIDPQYCVSDGESATKEVECNTDLCPEAGEWAPTGDCYQSGDDCVINLERECIGEPALTEECSTSTQDCGDDCIRVDYKYGEWSECDSECSPGQQSRVGVCVNVIDDTPSTLCDPLTDTQWQDCDIELCAEYTEWEESGTCSKDCGGGEISLSRNCVDETSTVPEGCGVSTASCNEQDCVTFGAWTAYSPCSESCKPGEQSKTRECFVEGTTDTSDDCDLADLVETKPCNADYCENYSEFNLPPGGGCFGSRASCQDPMIVEERECLDDDREVPEVCRTQSEECDPDQPLDILVMIDNTRELEMSTCGTTAEILHPDSRLDDPSVLPNFVQQKEFLKDLICGFNVFSADYSRLAIYETQTSGSCDNKLTDLDDHDLITAVDERPLRCTGYEFLSSLHCPVTGENSIFMTEGSRADAHDVVLYVLPPILTHVTTTISPFFTEAYSSFLPMIKAPFDDKTFAVISTEPIDELEDNKQTMIYQLACWDASIDTCDNYIGNLGENVNVIISRLMALINNRK